MDENNFRRVTLRRDSGVVVVDVAPANSVFPVVGEKLIHRGEWWMVEKNEPTPAVGQGAWREAVADA